MSIDRNKGRLQLVCDTCGSEYQQDYSSKDFNDMISDAKQDGWSVFKNDDHEWTHMCRGCKNVEVAA